MHDSADTERHPIFIGGCPRSGTTLLGSIIGTHSQCLCTPESSFRWGGSIIRQARYGPVDAGRLRMELEASRKFRGWSIDGHTIPPDPSYKEVIGALVREYGARLGADGKASHWVDHSPQNMEQAVHEQSQWPDARFIHVLRDGRAVAASVIPLDWGPNTVKHAAKWWSDKTLRAMAAMSRLEHNRVCEVRYEDLVVRPEETVRAICDWLDFEYEPEMLTGRGFLRPASTRGQHAFVGSAPAAKKASDWRSNLTGHEVATFEAYAGDWLDALNYQRVTEPGHRVGRLTSAMMSLREIAREPGNRIRYWRRYRIGAER